MSASSPQEVARPERPTCNARTKKGGRCKVTALYPNGRCRMHGGPSKSGVANGNYKHGRHSKVLNLLPKNLGEVARAAVSDPDRMELQTELALLRAQLYDSVSRWDATGPQLWDESQTIWAAYRAARSRGNAEGMADAIKRLESLSERGYVDYLARKESRDIIQDIRKVSESERRRMVDAQYMLSADQVVLLMSRVTEAIMAEVTDPDVLQRLTRRFTALLQNYRHETLERIAG